MRILVVTDHFYPGGANIAAWRLIEGLCAAGVEVIHANLTGTQPPVVQSRNYRTENFFGGRSRALADLFETSGRTGFANRLQHRDLVRQTHAVCARVKPDIVHLHNLHAHPFALDFLEAIPADLPVVWTLHDQWSFTGRCAYAYDCERFIEGCNEACPTAEEVPALTPAAIAPAWVRKRDLLKARPHWAAITPSRWLAGEAERGLWKGHPVAAIANGLPLDVFFPVDRQAAKVALGLDPKIPAALVSASNLSERRKGGDILVRSLNELRFPLQVITLGDASLDSGNALVMVRHLGFLRDSISQRLAYSAADLVLHPAPVDNLPNVVAEANACGCPVLAFPIGGLPEMIDAGKTGWLCENLSSGAFLGALEDLLAEPEGVRAITRTCRDVAAARYDLAARTADTIAFLQQQIQ